MSKLLSHGVDRFSHSCILSLTPRVSKPLCNLSNSRLTPGYRLAAVSLCFFHELSWEWARPQNPVWVVPTLWQIGSDFDYKSLVLFPLLVSEAREKETSSCQHLLFRFLPSVLSELRFADLFFSTLLCLSTLQTNHRTTHILDLSFRSFIIPCWEGRDEGDKSYKTRSGFHMQKGYKARVES